MSSIRPSLVSTNQSDDVGSVQQTSVVESSVEYARNQFAEEYLVAPLRAIKSHPWDDFPHLITLLLHGVLFPLQTTAMAYIPYVQWGYISWDIIANIYTFGMHLLPYEGILAFTSLVFALDLVWIGTIYVAHILNGKDMMLAKRIKPLAKYLTIFLFVLSIPIASYWERSGVVIMWI